jgi:hypothetical protein
MYSEQIDNSGITVLLVHLRYNPKTLLFCHFDKGGLESRQGGRTGEAILYFATLCDFSCVEMTNKPLWTESP